MTSDPREMTTAVGREDGLLLKAQDEIAVAMGNVTAIPMSDNHRAMVMGHLSMAHRTLDTTQAPAGEVLALREALQLMVDAHRNAQSWIRIDSIVERTAGPALTDTAPAAEAAIAEIEKPWREAALVLIDQIDGSEARGMPVPTGVFITAEPLRRLLTKPTDHDEGEGK